MNYKVSNLLFIINYNNNYIINELIYYILLIIIFNYIHKEKIRQARVY